MVITFEEFKALIGQLEGVQVSRPWRGYGSALFLELGELHPPENPRIRGPFGEACLMMEWEWRIENNRSVIFGSSNTNPSIENHLSLLLGLKLNCISVYAEPPELVVSFTNDLRLRSMVMCSGDPQWAVKLLDATWLSFEHGSFVRRTGNEPGRGLSPEEEEIMRLADKASERWGIPSPEPIEGECRCCHFFTRIDGEFALLDYGVCIAEHSPFDGRAVNVTSGCPVFKPVA